MTDPTDRDRLVILETKQVAQEALNTTVATRLDSIDANVSQILRVMDTHKGFFKGMVFTFGLVGTIIGAAAATLVQAFLPTKTG